VEFTLDASGDKRVVTIPVLEDGSGHAAMPAAATIATRTATVTPAAPAAPAPAASTAAEASAPAPASTTAATATPAASTPASDSPAPLAPTPPASSGFTTLQTTGLIAGAAGIVGIGVGAAFGIRAMAKNNDAKAYCNDDLNLCEPQGKQDRNTAINDGNVSTVAFVAGGILAATGATLFLYGRRSESRPAAGITTLRAMPLVSSDGAGGSLVGTF
jgi:hypothetical protein